MGHASSKFTSQGALKGAYAPPLEGVELPAKMDPKFQTYEATIPPGKRAGDVMIFNLLGNDVPITIPDRIKTKDGRTKITQPGDKFHFTYGNRDKVIASTLPSLPGTTVVEAKPMVFANVSHAFYAKQYNGQQSNMSRKVGSLMQEAQTILLQQAVEAGCNAVLGINSNISTDSSGEHGNSKIVIVTLVGTPCVVMRLDTLPAVESEAVLVPEMVF